MLYERTQPGYLFVALLLASSGVIGWIIYSLGVVPRDKTILLLNVPILLALLISAVVFSSMTIRVSSGRLDWWLGFRSFHRTVILTDVKECQSHVVPPIAGLGIRTNDFKSWLILVGGRKTVALKLTTGSTLMLGSPEPEIVCSMINDARTTKS